MHILTNPGFYENQYGSFYGPGMIAFVIVVSFAVILLVLIGVELPDDMKKLAVFFIVSFTIATSAFFIMKADQAQNAKAQAVHAELVITWLSEGYGIDFKAANVAALLEGDPFTVDYAGELTSVNVQPGPDSTLSLVDQEHTILPLNE